MASACHEMGGALKEAVRGSTFREKDGAAGKSLLVAALPGMLSKRVSGHFFEALGRIIADAQAEDEVREDWVRVIGDAAETMLDEMRPLEEAGPDRLAGWLAQRRFLRAAVKGTSQTGRKIRSVLGLPQVQKAKDAEVPGAGELEDANP